MISDLLNKKKKLKHDQNKTKNDDLKAKVYLILNFKLNVIIKKLILIKYMIF